MALEIVHVESLLGGAKLDVALCAVAEGREGAAYAATPDTNTARVARRRASKFGWHRRAGAVRPTIRPGRQRRRSRRSAGPWPRPLTVLPENEADKTRLRLSSSVNRSIYLESFMVIQNNMFESGKCVMGIADADWTVMCESRRRRYQEGLTLAEGQHGRVRQDAVRTGKLLDALEVSTKVHNELLCLPQKDLDEATKDAIMLAEVLKQRAERKAKEAGSSCS
ncbi:hypothetical protein NHJ13051_004450 [Beauveria bassiana]